MLPIVYLNGEFILEEKAFIPVTDRGFLFGEGAFNTIKVQDGFPEFLHIHLKKLASDCEVLGIAPQNISHETIQQLIEKNQAHAGTWRLKIILSRGIRDQLLITLKPYGEHVSPCRLTRYPNPICHLLARVKSLAFIDHLLAAEYARQQGFDDALVLDQKGIILETSVANVFWRQGYDLFFPDPELFLYQGITLQVVLAAAKKMGLKSHPIKTFLEDISENSHFFLCNSMRGIVPVVSIDAKKFNRDLSFEQDLYVALAKNNKDKGR